ncbi:MAG TPA: spore coat protein [Firmicutes bacterium]|jgi:glucose-1-phosphate thymidylyltransferase|nr:spore coat protein [Bacillota bacterium]
MKGIILAGGAGTRLSPLTEIINKHLLAVGREPMIWHPIRHLIKAGISEILIVSSAEHMGLLIKSLGSGKRFGCELTYRVQEEAGGIAHALACGERFADGDRIVVLLGDNIFEYAISTYVGDFLSQATGARILLKEVGDPERFGIANFYNEKIASIEEKPTKPKSYYAVIGCYMYDNQVFDFIRMINPSARGELEITAVNNLYIQQGQMEYSFVHGRWTDAGTYESLYEANIILSANNNKILTKGDLV